MTSPSILHAYSLHWTTPRWCWALISHRLHPSNKALLFELTSFSPPPFASADLHSLCPVCAGDVDKPTNGKRMVMHTTYVPWGRETTYNTGQTLMAFQIGEFQFRLRRRDCAGSFWGPGEGGTSPACESLYWCWRPFWERFFRAFSGGCNPHTDLLLLPLPQGTLVI